MNEPWNLKWPSVVEMITVCIEGKIVQNHIDS